MSVAADASLEDKVAFLLRREEQMQTKLDDLAEAVLALTDELASRLSEQRASMEAHLADALRAAHQAYLPLRLLGVVPPDRRPGLCDGRQLRSLEPGARAAR